MDKISGAGAGVPQKTGFLKKIHENITGGVQTTLDKFVPGGKDRSVEINTNIPGYQEIKTEDAAKMVGYFTQKMESQGFPWALYKPKTGIRKKDQIGEFEALRRLEKGESVIFQPKRVIGIGFSPPQFKGKDVTGKVLVYPTGKGSTGDPYSCYFLKRGGHAPVAVVNRKANMTTVVASIICEIPLIHHCDKDPLTIIETGDWVRVDSEKGNIVVKKS